MALQKALGVQKLKGKEGEVEVSSLEGKYILLYFSAHWCPPCRQFTPILSKFYKDLKVKRTDFEVVFISSDKTEEQFTEYYKEHPWLALPFSERKLKEKLSRKFKVQGIPSLIILDGEAETINSNARSQVVKDPEGKKFPWAPRKAFEILAETPMFAKDGKELKVDDLKKLEGFALYFSAHWCPPCRAFTPRLVSTYNKMKKNGKSIEIIFVSSDKDESQFQEYYEEMPWARLLFQDPRIAELKELCEVDGIPSLATISKEGKILNKDARGLAADDESGAGFPWVQVQLEACNAFTPNDAVVDALNGDLCVILHLNDAANRETARIEFRKAAEKFSKEVPTDSSPVRFFICDSGEGNELYERVLLAIGAKKGSPGTATVIAMNLPNNRAKHNLSGEISQQNIFDFALAFKKGQDAD
jgi:nucleoredoxin